MAQQAQNKINQKLRREIIVDCYSPVFEKDDKEYENILEKIRTSVATVLVVVLGALTQEKWISKYKKQLSNVIIFLAIAATIDFKIVYELRSPKWISEVLLVLVYRLLSEPRRF
ncbi:WecB/TagA/CpsF family glycosyltransferase [cyanobacterium endosymbiont of Epithemia turgida]|uniref:WecB/TagA/CpsF family glycosyltransferase n=1 Tax=cyanobacterium endosymbiont of Epithemia turgida TaxID=718217 RepID=UPI001E4960C2|nr:WecB/TagA/CpsF family glycosyltransferase [cyanobacterium endosymbiont of Epithemia turgida]